MDFECEIKSQYKRKSKESTYNFLKNNAADCYQPLYTETNSTSVTK